MANVKISQLPSQSLGDLTPDDVLPIVDAATSTTKKVAISDLDSYFGGVPYPTAGIPVSTGSAWGTSKTAPTGTIVGDSDTQTLTNKTISGISNTLTNISLTSAVTGTLPVANGGTGATDAATARTNLGLGTAATANTTAFATAAQGAKADTALQPAAIGVSVQAYDADLTSWAAIAPSAKQDTLVSGTNIKTVNGSSLLGSGNLVISGGGGSGDVVGPASSVDGNIALFDGATGKLLKDGGVALSAKQDTLVSGTSIKTVNSTSLLGSGDLAVQPTLVSGTNIKTVNGNSLLGSGDLTISGGSSTLTIQNKTAAYTVVAGDNGTIINCPGFTFTVSLTAAATLGAGFNCWIWNNGNSSTDTITIDPNGAETIDGRSTLILRRGEGTQIICDGTNWQTGGKKTMRGYAESYPENTGRPVASGASAIAIGAGAASSTTYATAIGQNSSAGGSQAVTGSGAMALGGSYASGTDSFAAAVASNTSSYGATSDNAVSLGYQAKASGTYSFAVGRQAQAQANSSFAFGYTALASAGGGFAFGEGAQANGVQGYAIGVGTRANGSRAIAIGGAYGAQAIGDYSIAIGSTKAYEYNKYTFGGANTAQYGVLPLWKDTIDATPTVLISYTAGSPSTTNQLILQNNSAYAFTGTVVARQQASGGTASAAWKVEGLIRREGTAGTTTLVASTVTAISNVPGWTLALSADTTNGGLAVTATGAAATNIRWVATIQTSEVTYA